MAFSLVANQEVWIVPWKTFLCDSVTLCCDFVPALPLLPQAERYFFLAKSAPHGIRFGEVIGSPGLFCRLPSWCSPLKTKSTRQRADTWCLSFSSSLSAFHMKTRAQDSLRKDHLFKSHPWLKMFGKFLCQRGKKYKSLTSPPPCFSGNFMEIFQKFH